MTAGYLCALLLAAVFVWAAAAKLAHVDRTAEGFRAMGVAGARTMAVAVPIIELALAVALVAEPGAGGVASLVALVGFSALLVRAMRAGVAGGCACFGAAGTQPVSGRDLVRNAALAALAIGSVFS